MKYDVVEGWSDKSYIVWIRSCVQSFNTHGESGSVCNAHNNLRSSASLCALRSMIPIPPLFLGKVRDCHPIKQCPPENDLSPLHRNLLVHEIILSMIPCGSRNTCMY
jgi:hypothetical protein